MQVHKVLTMDLDKLIEGLIPTDREQFKKIFKIEDSDVDYYKKELREILYIAHPNITWDEDTKEVVLKGFGTVKGLNILSLFSDFMCQCDWLMYTMGAQEDEDMMVEDIKKLFIGEARLEKMLKEKCEKLMETSAAQKNENFWKQ